MTRALQRHREQFDSDPARSLSFEALEEHHFLQGEWEELAKLYERRLEAPALRGRSAERVRLLFRLGQVLEERCGDPARALDRYRQAVEIEPSFVPAVRQLRRIYAGRSQWELVLQVAEVEGALPMRGYEAASFHAELGEVWAERMGDPAQALPHFESALEASAGHEAAAAGRARCLTALGRAEEAAQAWTALLERLSGQDRAPVLVAVAKLLVGPLAQPDRAFEAYRRALTEDPRCREALDALVVLATDRGQWPLVAELQERRFELATSADERLAVALEAGGLELRLRNPHGARLWYRRARELAPDEARVELALAEVERLAGRRDELVRHLEGAFALDARTLPVQALLELATLAAARGAHEDALARVRLAVEHAPQSEEPAVLAALDAHLARAGRFEERIDVLERRAALAVEPRLRAGLLAELAALLEDERGTLQPAWDAYRRAFDADPSLPGLTSAIERVLAKAEDWEALRAHLTSAVERGPAAERAHALCALGEVLAERLRDPDGALRAFEAALAAEPGCEPALRGLERVALRQGDGETILRAYEREVAIASEPGRRAFLLGEIVRLLETDDRAEEALMWAEQLAATMPGDPGALATCARLQDLLEDPVGLAGTLEKLDLVCAPGERAVHRRRLAELHRTLDDEERAVAWCRAALESEPGHEATLESLAELLERAGRLAELAEVQREIAERESPPRRAARLDALARLLVDGLGDLEGARATLVRLAAEPNPPPDLDERLEALLERMGRDAELAEHLARRRAALADGDPRAVELDLRRGEILLERLDRAGSAGEVFRRVLAFDASCERAERGLAAALRAANDLEGLAALLAERAARAGDGAARERTLLERAVLLEEGLGEIDDARRALVALADSATDGGVRRNAAERLEALLERRGDWAALRARLETRLGRGDRGAERELHERLAALVGSRLGDRAAALTHLEAAGGLAPERAEIWRRLAVFYDEDGRHADLLRVIESELATRPDAERELRLRSRAATLCREADPGRAEAHYRRVLELSPSQPDAAQFLTARYEAAGRHAELLAVLEPRLAELASGSDAASRLAVRLRIASLLAGPLEDPEGALRRLEPALADGSELLLVAEPLATLYERTGRTEALLELCRHAAGACELPAERAEWRLRLGAALRASGRDAEAAGAYAEALADRPGDRAATAPLCELYRGLGEAGPLARLLEEALARVGGRDEIPLLRELAELYAGPLGDPGTALVHQRRILELDPEDGPSLERAIELAASLGHDDLLAALLEAALRRTRDPAARADLLARKGELLAGSLGRPEDGIALLRAALLATPRHAAGRSALRRCLESLSRWSEVLDLLHVEADEASGAARLRALEEGAALAAERLGAQAALPWLERLRVARPEDPSPLARIAAIHREGDRPRAQLRALEAELALDPPLARRRDLHVERAEVLERRLGLESQAVQALEEARACAPDDLHVLRELDRLNSALGRSYERAEILVALVPLLPAGERNGARRARAGLLADPLGEPAEAARVLEEALAHPEEGTFERTELLRSLGAAYRAARRPEDLARVAEEELRELEEVGDEACTARRAGLHDELARLYGRELADPARELAHLRAFVDGGGATVPSRDLVRVEARLLDRLRATGDTVELAGRLAGRLARETRDAEGWLELARLEEERFARPAAAAAAYGRVLAIDASRLDALRGLRRSAERLGDPEALIQALEGELEHDPSLPPAARGVILRRVGQVAWRELGSTTRASRAFARALEVEPGDLASLRALEEIFESMEDWRGALDLYESEVETLGEAEPERRRGVWLRVAELARDRTRDARRALHAFEAAARIGALEPRDQIAWAELALSSGDRERFAELFGRWCDDPRSGARAEDELRLAGALEVLGRASDALVRAERATTLDPESVEAWDAVAHLRGLAGDAAARGDALERAAELLSAGHAVERLCAAAETLAEEDPTRALDLLGRAVERDPASVRAHAALALRAAASDELETASRAARRALELDGSARELELAARGLLARTGGRAARARSDLAAAAELFEALLDVEPEDPEGLATLGEIHLELGRPGAALPLLERRLALPGSGDERAHLLVLRARALEATGRVDESLAACEEARSLDPRNRHALAIRARLLERAGRRGEAIDAFELHARFESDPIESARLLTKAAALALGVEPLPVRAEGWLREATRSDPASGAAWLLLARSLAGDERFADALAAAEAALASAGASPESAEIAALRAEALEALGERRAAAEAHRDVALGDPSRLANGLASARLYRSLGEWQAGAELLRSLSRTGAGEAGGRAGVHFELARLLAGPLEDVPGAIDAYRSALAANPGLCEARRALADLLLHRPELRAEALALHRTILAETPCRVASLRGLVRLAQGRSAAVEATALTVLRALGAASPDERERASAVVTPAPGALLEDPSFECARELVRGAAPEIGQALLAASPNLEPTSEDPVERFRARLLACEAEFAAPGLARLANEELAELVGCLVRLAQETDAAGGDGPLADGLAAALGRRTRRRLGRILEERGAPAEALASIDFGSWRAELRALAAAEALRRSGETLRTALLALLSDEPGLRPAPEADLAPLVERAPAARALVRRLVLGGCEALVTTV